PFRVRELRPEVPVELEAIVHKCLEKKPAARYDSAEELACDLDRFARGEPVKARPLTPLRRALRAIARNRRLLGRAAVAVVVLWAAVVVGMVAGNRPRSEQDPGALDEMRADLAAGKAVTLIGKTGEPRWRAWVHGPAAFAVAKGRNDACSYQA